MARRVGSGGSDGVGCVTVVVLVLLTAAGDILWRYFFR
jgi:hypothetical protein